MPAPQPPVGRPDHPARYGLPQLPNVTQPDFRAYYRALSGEQENWDDYRAAMVADRRVVVRLTPDRAYGMV